MPPPRDPLTIQPPSAALQTPTVPLTAAGGSAAAVPPTPAEMEAQSLALAYQLQQEEHSAFMQAVRVSSPGPRLEAGANA